MQRSWRNDTDKLTFICCLPLQVPSSLLPSTEVTDEDNDKKPAEQVQAIESIKHDAPDRMIGDVNLFLYPSEDDDQDDTDAQTDSTPRFEPLIGELEIMIAHPKHQNLGLGTVILSTFLWYILSHLSQITSGYSSNAELTHLRVKISAENLRSIRLFEKVGFKKVCEEPNYFGEVELRWGIGERETKRKEVEERLGYVPRVLVFT